eukprot:UN00712
MLYFYLVFNTIYFPFELFELRVTTADLKQYYSDMWNAIDITVIFGSYIILFLRLIDTDKQVLRLVGGFTVLIASINLLYFLRVSKRWEFSGCYSSTNV